jgi:protein involved in polysaccharide export with SLBB domain
MHKHAFVVTIILAIAGHVHSSPGQTASSQPNKADSILIANGSTPGMKAEVQLSKQAISEAKKSYKLGVKYGHAGHFAQAAESFQKAIQLQPNYADAHYGLGHAYFDLKRYQEASKCFEQTIKLNPKDEEAYAKLGEIYLIQQRTKPSSFQNEKGTAEGVNVSLNVAAVSSREASAGKLTSTEVDLTRVYRVGVGDVLDVRLGDASASQSTLFTVTPAGLLEHPNLAEPLKVSGLTVDEISARMEDDLKRRAVNESAKVFVGIREYLSHAILVSGLVKESGTKLLRREGIPLYVVIADAQPLAEAGRVTLIRHETGETLSADLSQPAEMNLLVRPGDVLTVQKNPSQFFYVGGEVKGAGERQFRPGLTLTQAILSAGGLIGKAKEVQLARESTKGFLLLTRYKLKDINSGKILDPQIQPGDRITVER